MKQEVDIVTPYMFLTPNVNGLQLTLPSKDN